MIIQHNIMALNAHRQLGGNTNNVTKNLEKLSSGFRINRAGDDAAGLAISEKMRAQITGLTRAQSNAQDGISLVQTAEGALTEVHSMLNRMVDLSTQSSNGTLKEDDRQKIQDEMNALTEEIDRISKSTNFNGINLLDGSLGGTGSVGGSTGKLVATVEGTLGSLKTGQSDALAAKGVYTADLSGTILGTGTAATDQVAVTVEYVDTNGQAQTKRLEIAKAAYGTADALSAAIATAIDADTDLNKLFDADGTTATSFTMTANTGGTSGAQFKGIKIEAAGTANGTKAVDVKAKTTTAATDATTKDIIAIPNAPAAGDKITVGDKTYEFIGANGDASGVGKGNVAVVLGTAQGASVTNLVKALNANGVKSATLDTNDIKIGDLNEIKAAEKKASIVGNSGAFTTSSVLSQKDKASFTVGKAAAASDQYLELKYLDEEGKEQTAKVKYTADATANTNATNIAAAINADKVLGKLFTAVSGTGVATVEAKTPGAMGAKLIGIKTDDINSASVGALKTVVSGRDAGQTISIDAGSLASGDTLSVNGKTFEFVTADKIGKLTNGNIAVLIDPKSDANTAANLNLAAKSNNVKMDFNAATNSFFVADNAASSSGGSGLTLQIGDTADDFNKVTVSVADMGASGLGIKDIEVTEQGVSDEALVKIKGAINTVSTNRSAMGALQNRLEHTINNLGVATENMTAAESRIRDVDMAKEMMHFTKNNVLSQAAQAMLAQANQQPQQVLQLLR